jgi:hypothetical protein
LYTEKNEVHVEPYGAYWGIAEGTPVNAGFGPARVNRYVEPKELLVQMVNFPGSPVRVIDKRDITSDYPALNAPIYKAAGIVHQVAEMEYRFTRPGETKERCGLAFCTNRLSRGPVYGQWHSASISTVRAPQDRMKEAFAVAIRAFVTTTPNAEWVKIQQQGVMDRVGIISKAGQEIAANISDSYWYKDKVSSEIYKKYSDTTRGTYDLYNPATGTFYTKENKHKFYWVNNRGFVTGNETGTSPGLDFTPLKIIP